MKSVYVDADACPVKNEILSIADRHDIKVYVVSNRGFRTGDRPNVQNILVSDKFDAAMTGSWARWRRAISSSPAISP